MASETTITMVGNLVDDPDMRFTPAGVALVKFTIASTPRVRDPQTGEYRDGDPLFMACTAWRDLAEHIAESLRRGTRVVVSGRLRLSRWETPEGDKRSMYQLDVDEVGPSLRFATAQVRKATRTKAADGFTPDQIPDDPWATATPAAQSRQQTASAGDPAGDGASVTPINGPATPATPAAGPAAQAA
jgi:single-strand DNA-binding protein